MGELVTGQAATYVEELWIETEKRYQIHLHNKRRTKGRS